MSRRKVAACLLALGVASCGGQAPQPASAPDPAAAGDRIEWQGIVACADCDAIQVVLVLAQDRGKRRYTLTENYIAGSHGERFVERGEWQRSAGLLRLHGDAPSARVYALLPDGSLQARDSRGQPLANASDELLLPVAFSSDD
jgi:hypothetical protein